MAKFSWKFHAFSTCSVSQMHRICHHLKGRVIQMPTFLKIQPATGFSCDIYHNKCENAKKFQKKMILKGDTVPLKFYYITPVQGYSQN